MGLIEAGPVVWRGPLVMSALERLLRGTLWGSTEILIVDTPPGTGDVHLSLHQNVPISAVILVSTPQRAALEVTKRGAEMYKKLNTPIIGLVENMSFTTCDQCGHETSLFENITNKFTHEINTKVLARIPLERNVSQCSDSGTPVSMKLPGSSFSKLYESIAEATLIFLEKHN